MRYALPAVVATVVLATFAPTHGFDFVNWDDRVHVTSNPAVVGGATWRERLLTPSLGYPIPVTVATYAFEHRWFGTDPRVYHVTNLVIHLLSCLCVFELSCRLGLTTLGAAAAMLLFGLHPVVAEPVSWVSGRKDLLATLLALASTLCFERWLRGGDARFRVLAVVAFVLAVFSKPSVLGLALLPAFVHWRVRNVGAKLALRSTIPEVAVALVGAAFAFIGQWTAGAVNVAAGPASHARCVWYALGYHLGLLGFVQPTRVKPIPAAMPPAFDPQVDLLPLACVGLAAWAWRRWSSARLLAVQFGVVWAVLAYLPNSNVVLLARYLADSYVYLPLIGPALILGAAVDDLRGRSRPTWVLALLAGTAVALAVPAARASARWRDGVTLWQSAAAGAPASPQICRALGNAYVVANRLSEGLVQYKTCARRFGAEPVEKNIAIVLVAMGRFDEAAPILDRLAATRPDDPIVRKYRKVLAEHRQSP
jgi:hypothetical protein